MAGLDKSRLFTIAAGTLVAVGGFVLVLWGVAWFMPRFLRYSDSPWMHGIPVVVGVLTSIGLLTGNLRKRHEKTAAAKTSQPNL